MLVVFLGITPIAEHHSLICSKLFDEVVSNPNHKLNSLLPLSNNVKYKLRNHRPFVLPRAHRKKGAFDDLAQPDYNSACSFFFFFFWGGGA